MTRAVAAERDRERGLLARLRDDRKGNTMALMAIAMIPIAGFAGSAVDVARVYVVKSRLQQACDAGVLAGRKFMTDSNSSTLDATADTQARTFFANNFRNGWLNTHDAQFTPSKTPTNEVNGVAKTTVPMALMSMFGVGEQVLNVSCQARFDIADTDVMFVLDTTGSMACGPSDPDSCGQPTISYPRNGSTSYYIQEKSNARIVGLRAAVLSFYDTVAANADPSTHIRYGFVPYASSVNAGTAIRDVSPSYLVSTWNYQSRKVIGDANNGSATTTTSNNLKQSVCNGFAGRSPATGYTTNGTAVVSSVQSFTANNGSAGPDPVGTCVIAGQPVKPNWRYAQWPFDVSQYVAGASVTDPSKVTGAKSTWQGCVEERDTTASSSFDPNNLPPDLNPDLVPTNDATRWRPMWPDVVYYRGNSTSIDDSGTSTNPYGDSNNNFWFGDPNGGYFPGGYLVCGKSVQRLAVLSRDDVNNYLTAPEFKPWGGTYHDTGMIWGTRMISPTGIFAGDTSAWPGRNAPNRYIVFLTDGHMATNQYIYGVYGWENYDQRTTGGNFSSSDAYHNARFLAECTAAKNRNIKVYVVSVAATLDPNLTACASPGPGDDGQHLAFYASSNAALTTAFQNIAKQVAMLRITQ